MYQSLIFEISGTPCNAFCRHCQTGLLPINERPEEFVSLNDFKRVMSHLVGCELINNNRFTDSEHNAAKNYIMQITELVSK